MKRIVVLSTVAAFGMAFTVSQLLWAAPAEKVLICHVDPDCDDGGPHVISVSGRALDAHLDHGDCGPLDPAEWSRGDSCEGLCSGEPDCPE